MRRTVSIRELNQATSAVVRKVADTHQPLVSMSNNTPTEVVLSPVQPVSGGQPPFIWPGHRSSETHPMS